MFLLLFVYMQPIGFQVAGQVRGKGDRMDATMEKTIELEKKRVEYTLRLSKWAKQLRLSVASGGVFTVTAPSSVSQSRIEEFIQRKAGWVLGKINYFGQFPKRVVIKNKRTHFVEYKPKARTLVWERLAHFNQRYHFKWNSVTIRNQRSRWGSCSRKSNLNFNYKIALLPPHLSDYLIVHELCHLGQLNHSRAFWSLVAHTLPDYQILRAELCRVGVDFV